MTDLKKFGDLEKEKLREACLADDVEEMKKILGTTRDNVAYITYGYTSDAPTLFDIAWTRRNNKVAKFLIEECGADINMRVRPLQNTFSLLIFYYNSKNYEMVDFLLEKGARVSDADYSFSDLVC